MKQYSFIFIPLFIFPTLLCGQSGTIKIAKPKQEKEVIPPPSKNRIGIGFEAGTNYTFKKNDKVGYGAGILISPRTDRFYVPELGLAYSHEKQYFSLSGYNVETNTPQRAIARSQTTLDYLKLPIFLTYGHFVTGRSAGGHVAMGVIPKYLLKAANEDGRIRKEDLNEFNLAWCFKVRFPLGNRASLQIRYSKDLFENIKDRDIYTDTGAWINKQRSKTGLIEVSLASSLSGFNVLNARARR